MQSSVTVLCVDDDQIVLTTLALVLRSHGFTVMTARNAQEALKLASTARIDIALLDHSICDHECLCLRDHLRERQPAIKAIMHTGDPEAVECLGCVPILAKPAHPEEIARKIREVLAAIANGGEPAA